MKERERVLESLGREIDSRSVKEKRHSQRLITRKDSIELSEGLLLPGSFHTRPRLAGAYY